jgi:hypothetical protein
VETRILYCIAVGSLKASVVPLVALGSAFNWTFKNLSAHVVRPAFYSSMSDSYTVTQGPTGGPRLVGSLYSRTLMAMSSKCCLQRCGHAWSCHLPRCTRSAAWRRAVESLGTVAVPGKWSTVLMLHYSRTIDACLHILQAWSVLPAHTSCSLMMALTSGVSEMCTCALGTCVWQIHLGEGFVDQDQLKQFSVKQEHNQYT